MKQLLFQCTLFESLAIDYHLRLMVARLVAYIRHRCHLQHSVAGGPEPFPCLRPPPLLPLPQQGVVRDTRRWRGGVFLQPPPQTPTYPVALGHQVGVNRDLAVSEIVSSEVESLGEDFPALVTHEWFLANVNIHVPLQMICLLKRLATYLAYVWSLIAVCGKVVSLQICEGLVALVTMERFLASVNLDVPHQMTCLPKRLATQLATVWALIAVCGKLVSLQI